MPKIGKYEIPWSLVIAGAAVPLAIGIYMLSGSGGYTSGAAGYAVSGPGWKARPGALVPVDVVPWLHKFSAAWGKPLEITSGLRTPEAQALAMEGLAKSGLDKNEMLRLYGNSSLIQEIVRNAYKQEKTATKDAVFLAPVAAATIKAQIAKKQYISQHLTGRALDFSIKDLPENERQDLLRLALSLGAKGQIEREPLHLHLQGIPVSGMVA